MGDTSSSSLAGKVAIVTGGGRGIGRAVATALAREGARVCVVARSAGELDDAVEEIRGAGGEALAVACDITDRAAVDRMVETAFATYGRLDVLVNNAGGGGERASVEQSDPEVWVRGIELNLFGTYYVCRAAIPQMARGGGGKIINIGSGVGHTVRPGNTSYASSKAALRMFTRSLALEVWKQGIEVNEVIPGPVYTKLTEPFFEPGGKVPPGGIESERVKTPEECVPLILFLAAHPPGGPIGQTFSLARRPI